MTEDQLKDAVRQMQFHCNLLMETDYSPVSARGILYKLGYTENEAVQVLQVLYDGGFNYCLDPDFHQGSKARIASSVCYWGPDQLHSRIQCSVPWDWQVTRSRSV